MIDWWSLGAFIYEIMTGLPPFFDESVNSMYEKILNEQVHFPEHLSEKARNIINRLLEKDSSKRLGSKGAAEVKADPFFENIDWEKLLKKEVEPPFKPLVQNEADTAMIDEEYRTEVPNDSPVNASRLGLEKARFSNFSYNQDHFNNLRTEEDKGERCLQSLQE